MSSAFDEEPGFMTVKAIAEESPKRSKSLFNSTDLVIINCPAYVPGNT